MNPKGKRELETVRLFLSYLRNRLLASPPSLPESQVIVGSLPPLSVGEKLKPQVLVGPLPTLSLGQKLVRWEARWFGGYCGEFNLHGNQTCHLWQNHPGPHKAKRGSTWMYDG